MDQGNDSHVSLALEASYSNIFYLDLGNHCYMIIVDELLRDKKEQLIYYYKYCP